MDTALHIPWTNEVLEKLLVEIVRTGESTKLDFKSQWDISSGAQKAELARDIQALANSLDTAYHNYGFLILGATTGQLVHTSFPENADKMQATVDQIVREHLGPFIPTHVRQFGAGEMRWGVVVVPPSRSAPHVFLRDTARYSRGDIWIRIGTTTSKAEPADFARFFRVHLDDQGRELREEMRELQREIERLKVMSVPASPRQARKRPARALQVQDASEESATPRNILDAIRHGLQKTVDPISAALGNEAAALRAYLESRDIPWDLNNLTKDSGRIVVSQLNDRAVTFWKALATLVEYDEQGKYDDDVIEAVAAIAFDPQAPSGTPFTKFGTGIRLYPLTMALYIVFMIGLRQKRYKLLKHIMEIKLAPKAYAEELLPIGTALFYVRGASEVFQTVRDDYPEQRWCDGVGTYIQRWISSHLYPELPKLERRAELFYVAEFVLSLLAAATANVAQPSSGMFYFMSESAPIIRRYLKTEHEALQLLFGADLMTVLERFDEWGSRIANSGNCWGDGFQKGAVEAVFPKALS